MQPTRITHEKYDDGYERKSAMQLIVQYIFLLLGVVEIVTNGYYVFSGKTVSLGRKQHSELPKTASDRDVTRKVIRMLIVGIISFIAALSSLLFEPMLVFVAPVALLVIIGYEAARYRYWKIFCELGLVALLFGVTLFAFR